MSRPCPVCRHENPNDARFCFNPDCRAALDPEAHGGPVFQAGAPVRTFPTWAKVAVPVGAVALLGVGAAIVGASRSPTRIAATTVPITVVRITTTTTAAAAATSTTVGVTTTTERSLGNLIPIASAEASSTLPADPRDGITYGIENTYDGKDDTAWNSNGSSGHQDPVGQKLTYTFAAPQNVTAIRIKNGFNVVTAARKWTDNHRVKGFRIRAGGKDVGVEAEDRPEAQYKENLGMNGVTSVEIEIVSVYPTTHWTDVAITEIQFFSPK